MVLNDSQELFRHNPVTAHQVLPPALVIMTFNMISEWGHRSKSYQLKNIYVRTQNRRMCLTSLKSSEKSLERQRDGEQEKLNYKSKESDWKYNYVSRREQRKREVMSKKNFWELLKISNSESLTYCGINNKKYILRHI